MQFCGGFRQQMSSSVWTLKSNKSSLYLIMTSSGGEIKSSIHPPSARWPGGKRHWGFTYEACSAVAQSAKTEGGRHKLEWRECR